MASMSEITETLTTTSLQIPSVALGERMKTYEKEDTISHENCIVIRVDGKNFSKFTKKFQKPFDVVFTKAMTWTLNDMMSEFNISLGFCCSDEITFVIPARSVESGHDFGGRVHKINSLYAGKCSVFFLLNILRAIQGTPTANELREHVINAAPCFDSRVMEFSPEFTYEIGNNIYWRSRYDCYRNCVSSVARHVLGTKGTLNLKGPDMIDKMEKKYQFDFRNDVHYSLQYGVYAKKCSVTLTNDKGEEYTRHHVKNFTMKLVPSEEFTEFALQKYCSDGEWERFEGQLMNTETLSYMFKQENAVKLPEAKCCSDEHCDKESTPEDVKGLTSTGPKCKSMGCTNQCC